MFDHDLVEADRTAARAVAAQDGDLEHVSLFDAIRTFEELLEAAFQPRFFDLREEAQASEVDPEDRNVVRRG